MAKSYYDITLALAGICQAGRLTQQMAQEGHCSQKEMSISLHSLLEMNPAYTLTVYGDNEANLKMGLETLLGVLNANRQGLSAELMRYALSLMVLERKLYANRTAMSQLGERIDQLDRQLAHFKLESETMINSLASIYIDIVSPVGPRIQVTGSPTTLQDQRVQAKVRAILLAGIRSAVLWRQVGGGRLQLMLSRSHLFGQAKSILARC